MDNQTKTQVYNLLVKMAQPAKQAAKELQKAKSKQEGAYTLGIQAAILAGSWAAFEPIITRLEDNVRKNRDNLAVKFGADKRAEEDKKGNKYKVPSSISTVKGRVKKAFERGVDLIERDKAGEPVTEYLDPDGNVVSEPVEGGSERPKARSYKAVSDELTAITQAEKEEREQQAAAKLTGDDKLRHEINEYCSLIVKRAADLQGATLAELHQVMQSLAGVEAEQSSGEQLSAEAEAGDTGEPQQAQAANG